MARKEEQRAVEKDRERRVEAGSSGRSGSFIEENLYTPEQTEWIMAVDSYRQEQHRQFPTLCEYLGILLGLGYRKATMIDGIAPHDHIGEKQTHTLWAEVRDIEQDRQRLLRMIEVQAETIRQLRDELERERAAIAGTGGIV